MKRLWGNERGSALLLVMLATVIAGILFASLYVVSLSEHKEALVHQEQVQAEYDAQTLMDVALYYYYLPAPADGSQTTFSHKFPSNNSCIDQAGNSVGLTAYPNVCLNVDASNKQTLIATGAEMLSSSVGRQTYTISYALGTATNGGGSGGGSSGSGGSGSPTDPSPGQDCSSTSDPVPFRAVDLGGDFDTTNAMYDEERVGDNLSADYPYSSEVFGGIYLANNGALILPQPKHNDKFDISVDINGHIAASSIVYGKVTGNSSVLTGPTTNVPGNNDLKNCNLQVSYEEHLNGLLTKYTSTPQRPVYVFDGQHKSNNMITLSDKDTTNTVTLASVLLSSNDANAKIIIVKGNLLLDPGSSDSIVSKAYLIVYNPYASDPTTSTIYLPDRSRGWHYFIWDHTGAIATEKIGTFSGSSGSYSLSTGWPYNYVFKINLTNGDYNLYTQ